MAKFKYKLTVSFGEFDKREDANRVREIITNHKELWPEFLKSQISVKTIEE